MSILRKRTRQDKFTVLPNDTLQDKSLSWKARGLLVYLLSMPDNWHFNQQDLKQRAPDGRSALRSGLDELEEKGYLDRQQSRNEEGNFGHNDWVVYESLSLRDDSGSPVVGKSDDGSGDAAKSDTTKDTEYKEPNNKSVDERAREADLSFMHQEDRDGHGSAVRKALSVVGCSGPPSRRDYERLHEFAYGSFRMNTSQMRSYRTFCSRHNWLKTVAATVISARIGMRLTDENLGKVVHQWRNPPKQKKKQQKAINDKSQYPTLN